MKKRIREFIENIKNFNPKFILKVESMIVIAFALVELTLTWFVLQTGAFANGLNIKAADDKYIRVALEPGGVDVLELQKADEEYAATHDGVSGTSGVIDLAIPNYYNTTGEEQTLAPGVGGSITLYVTSLKPWVDSCDIYVDTLAEYIADILEDEANGGTKKEELENLIEGHVQFYATYDDTAATVDARYARRITEENPLVVSNLRLDSLGEEVAADVGEEKKVTLYWIWFYEYTDMPQEAIAPMDTEGKMPVNRKLYFDPNVIDEDTDLSSFTEEALKEYLIEAYDYGDTRIGLGAQKMSFEIQVKISEDD